MPRYLGKFPRLPWAKVKLDYTSIPAADHGSPDRASSDKRSDDGFLDSYGDPKTLASQMHATRSLWKNPWFITAHLVTLFIYMATLALLATAKGRDCRNAGLPYSPAAAALVYEERHLKFEDRVGEDRIYVGEPSPKLDQAWHDLLDVENIKFEPEYFRHYGKEQIGVGVPGETGFIGTMNMYHELHCLKRLYQYIYQDHYFPGLSDEGREFNKKHSEHCIDFLRESAMCHGDIGLIAYVWNEKELYPVANATTHQCVNWNVLREWTTARTVDIMQPGWLVHPTKGIVYPDGEGDDLGTTLKHGNHGGH